MKIIISCCKGKNGNNLVYHGTEISFVSHPDLVPITPNTSYYHPDDQLPDQEVSWREHIAKQNTHLETDGMLRAAELYKPKIYTELDKQFGESLFILSAGWGLVNGNYYLPKYDITFSKAQNIPSYCKRKARDSYDDFNQLHGISGDEDLVFFGGADYISLFCKLVQHLPNNKYIYYKKTGTPEKHAKYGKSFHFIKYNTDKRTNWHYACAKDFLNGKLGINI